MSAKRVLTFDRGLAAMAALAIAFGVASTARASEDSAYPATSLRDAAVSAPKVSSDREGAASPLGYVAVKPDAPEGAGEARASGPIAVRTKITHATSDRVVKEISGVASWYGPGFHGRLTANGEIYNQNSLTAAHKSLPFNTRVRVTALSTGRSVVVKINDRGPYVGNRIIDLSAAAASAIGLRHQGVGKVKLEILEEPASRATASTGSRATDSREGQQAPREVSAGESPAGDVTGDVATN
ncbi:septal ring lytic transglycosylase RlpA family protein [Zavarzinia compransoris]|uniref:septal ring lytic transglycosylase RlpA family protein n=1 Tax=Zavarzinia marina TaxID=2911065 RepID=UPI001F229E42|nr:septal ring lytic transglycosylase RlpA family protein [Zavarzinia marina]MCF4165201.1 septal ring lytic transglycosylase RlpA family protein [Zavarzinia marina]